jgi:hypothetical protein
VSIDIVKLYWLTVYVATLSVGKLYCIVSEGEPFLEKYAGRDVEGSGRHPF